MGANIQNKEGIIMFKLASDQKPQPLISSTRKQKF